MNEWVKGYISTNLFGHSATLLIDNRDILCHEKLIRSTMTARAFRSDRAS
jgi:hypothetical protein